MKRSKVVHFEIPADDMERAGEFYRNVFGWEIQDAGVPGMPYHMARTVEVDDEFMPKESGAINGALFLRDEVGRYPMIVIDTEDIQSYIEKAKQHGGELVSEVSEVPNMGWYARIKDTEGNVIGIWEMMKKAD